ncbi:protein rolling stone-like [Bradysia coprophila]|uniref:protein rolling stone-like n=1 Tax=Bradysia coprophila TaxID=38358 RepID=UPI00187DDAA3|nr:protein rolling stone-like [Bradysia coprophila]
MTGTFLDQVRKELHIRNFCCNYRKPDRFVRSQWQLQPKNVFYLLWRIVLAAFFISAVITSMASLTPEDFRFYFIYLTNWGIILCMITSVYGAILVTYWHFNSRYADRISECNDMPFAFKFYWSIHNIILNVSIVITVIYWSILHTDSMPISATNVMTHAFNSVLMFVDMLIMAYPLRLYHGIQPILLGVVYVIFSIIYYYAGGKNKFDQPYIYNVLDWSSSDPKKNVVTVVGTLVLSMAIHLVLFGVYRLKVFLHRKCVHTDKSADLPTAPSSAAPNSRISMVLGSYEYDNTAFSGSTEKI